jgi:photosystem II stability/assembly factor-like uncharacterized protein
MKRKFTHLSILTLLLLSPAVNSFADGFYSVYSKDGITVWAAGNSGNLWRSLDGGQTWGGYVLGSATYYSIFASGSNVWTAGTGGTLQRSNNNGGSWTMSTISAQTLKSIFFTDANTGWIVGNAGTILKTTDAGATWTPQTSPVSNNLNSVKFTSSTNGVACGDAGKVIYTVNGGTTWSQYTTSTVKNLLSVDQKVSTIIATAEDGIIIKSTNNGTSWSTINYKIDTKSNVTGVSMIDATTFYSCGGGGFIRKSVDGGATFTFQQNPQMGNLTAIYFYNANSGWAVSSLNNAILRTPDGGNTWSFPPGTSVAFSWTQKISTSGNIGNGFCLHPTNKNEFFCMMGNNVYRTLDRGETWVSISTCNIGGSCHSFYVSPLDTNLMLCAKGSSNGYVAKSTNYGATWTAVYGPASLTSYGMPLEMDQNNPNVCYLGPDNNVLFRSTDFGSTWATWGAPPASYNGGVFRSPCDFAIVYENSNIMYCGDGTTGSGSGVLLKSTNAGQNWTVIHSISGSEIPMLTVTSHDPTLAYHTTWSSGGLWRSTNQFSTYLQVTTTGNMWAVDIARDDPTAVSYGTYGTVMYISSDNGINFTSSSAGGSYGAGELFYDKGTLIYQQGTGIYKLNISYTVPTSIQQISSETPREFALLQNYPNPFNPSTNFKYQIAKNSEVHIKVFDALGRELETLFDGNLSAGTYESDWSGTNRTSGIYFYTLIVNGERLDTKKMMLVK